MVMKGIMFLSDGDGRTDLLLPVCTTDFCEESHVYVYSDGQVGSFANFYCISISQIVEKLFGTQACFSQKPRKTVWARRVACRAPENIYMCFSKRTKISGP